MGSEPMRAKPNGLGIPFQLLHLIFLNIFSMPDAFAGKYPSTLVNSGKLWHTNPLVLMSPRSEHHFDLFKFKLKLKRTGRKLT